MASFEMSEHQRLEKKRKYEHDRRQHVTQAVYTLKRTLAQSGVHPWNLRTQLDVINEAILLINFVNDGNLQLGSAPNTQLRRSEDAEPTLQISQYSLEEEGAPPAKRPRLEQRETGKFSPVMVSSPELRSLSPQQVVLSSVSSSPSSSFSTPNYSYSDVFDSAVPSRRNSGEITVTEEWSTFLDH
jgi:hypothetical protein